jgi:hypothetical protein
VRRLTLAFVFAIPPIVVSLLVAAFVGGPIVRFTLGTPPSFRQHFMSSWELNEALLAQTLTLAIAFLGWGTAMGKRWRPFVTPAFAGSNPITLCVGFVLFKRIYESLSVQPDLGFTHVRNGAILAFLGFPLFAVSLSMGRRQCVP